MKNGEVPEFNSEQSDEYGERNLLEVPVNEIIEGDIEGEGKVDVDEESTGSEG